MITPMITSQSPAEIVCEISQGYLQGIVKDIVKILFEKSLHKKWRLLLNQEKLNQISGENPAGFAGSIS